jgi:hypothetical protein
MTEGDLFGRGGHSYRNKHAEKKKRSHDD